ncbi:MAG TPA: hypothetical protein VFL67_00065, partial [Mycobacterium sp.]|nr:hypothetical protein [Mycobacterium sp.]
TDRPFCDSGGGLGRARFWDTSIVAFDFEIPLSPLAKTYCDAIASAMISAFEISPEEAVGRINRHWRSAAFVEPEDVDTLLQELPNYWARRIYYPVEVDWWVVGEASLEPRPYP